MRFWSVVSFEEKGSLDQNFIVHIHIIIQRFLKPKFVLVFFAPTFPVYCIGLDFEVGSIS